MVIMKKTFLEWLKIHSSTKFWCEDFLLSPFTVGVKECKCHICKSNTSEEYVCEICDEYYCEECSSTYNQFSQIDYNCCEYCQEAVENKYRY